MDLRDRAAREDLRRRFEARFGRGTAPPACALAPGRVNLIGEHTDYNDGFVLPMAIDRHVAVVFRPRKGRGIRVHAAGQGGSRGAADDAFSTQAPIRPARRASLRWANYVRGVAAMLAESGVRLAGGDLFIAADLPAGAGLSSSAALEVATGLALLKLAGRKLAPQALALACQRAEHEFAGVRCGIMDQTVVARARAGHALLLDCRSLEVRHVPIRLRGWSFVLFDTAVRHRLAASAYNRRRAECERAARKLGVKALRDAGLEQLWRRGPKLGSAERRRVRHVLTENLRALQFADELPRGDGGTLGHLLNLSHESLRKDYEVSCRELDVLSSLVRIADQFAGDGEDLAAAGARMVGGGFGGCVLALVRPRALERLRAVAGREYERLAGRPLGLVLPVRPASAARVVPL
ncbi:MAG: galactokinase [Planctomycetota bacterium]|nr:galactokinase [Planctomycetota bacterium]